MRNSEDIASCTRGDGRVDIHMLGQLCKGEWSTLSKLARQSNPGSLSYVDSNGRFSGTARVRADNDDGIYIIVMC